MARTTGKTQTITVDVRARDKASPVLNKFKKQVSAMPEQFGKSAAAFTAFGAAAQGAGGKVAQTAVQLSGLGQLAATGGAFGIAIAGVTAAVGAGTKVWELYRAKVSSIKPAFASLEKGMSDLQARIDAQRKSLRDLVFEYKNLDLSTGERTREKLSQELDAREKALKATEADIVKMRERIQADKEFLVYAEKLEDAHKTGWIAAKKRAEQIESTIDVREESLRQLSRRIKAARTEYTLDRDKLIQDLRMIKARKVLEGATKDQADAIGQKNIKQKRSNELDREAIALLASLDVDIKRQAENEARHKALIAQKSALIDEYIAKREEQRNKDLAISEESIRYQDDQLENEKQMLQARRQMWASTAEGIAGTFGSAFASIATGSQDAGEAMKLAIVNAAEIAVRAYIAQAAAGAASSQSAIPIIGPALAIAASSMLAGIIRGYLSQIPKAASGGLIEGGIPGVDSVGVLTQRHEGILDVGQTDMIMRLGDTLSRLERKQIDVAAEIGARSVSTMTQSPQIIERSSGTMTPPPMQAQGNAPSIVINQQNAVPATSAEMAKAARDLRKHLRRAASRGF